MSFPHCSNIKLKFFKFLVNSSASLLAHMGQQFDPERVVAITWHGYRSLFSEYYSLTFPPHIAGTTARNYQTGNPMLNRYVGGGRNWYGLIRFSPQSLACILLTSTSHYLDISRSRLWSDGKLQNINDCKGDKH